jgi:hypothetical protein
MKRELKKQTLFDALLGLFCLLKTYFDAYVNRKVPFCFKI